MRLSRGMLLVALRAARSVVSSPRLPLGAQRKIVEAIARSGKVSQGVDFTVSSIAGVPVERASTPRGQHDAPTLLYLHGGGYSLGSARGYRAVVARFVLAGGFDVVTVDYSLSPESPFPTALHQARDVVLQLLADGVPASRLVIAGDSAGGGMALSLTQLLAASHDVVPAAVGLICPWLDIDRDDSGERRMGRDPLITPDVIRRWFPHYLGDARADDPRVSPLLGDLTGLPPIVMHTAGRDPLGSDAEGLQWRLHELGRTESLEHRVFPDLWHVFHLQTGILAEADEALDDMAGRLRQHADQRVHQ